MLFLRAGRTAIRQLSSSCAAHRADAVARVAASGSQRNAFALAIRVRSGPLAQLIASRAYATRVASKPKAHTGKSAASKKRSTKTSTKASASKKAKGTKAKAAAKPKSKPKKRVKKELTAEEKLAAEKRQLKKMALKPPPRLPYTAYTVIVAEKCKDAKGLATAEASDFYKNLSPREREHYNEIAIANKQKNEAAYKSWVESHSPEEIRQANNARARLRKMGVKGYRVQIKDSRQVKRPASARLLFLKEKYESGAMAGLSFTDAQKAISEEWEQMSASEKQKYYESEMKSREQYVKDVKTTYDRDISLNENSVAAQATQA